MKHTEIHSYVVEGFALSKLTTHPFDGLTLAAAETGEAVPCTVLDCFDQSLRRSGRILLRTDNEWVLVGGAAGVVAQRVNPGIRFLSDLADGPVQRGLKGLLSPLRSLLPVGTGRLQRHAWVLLDDEDKTHCRLQTLRLKAKNGRVSLVLALRGVRGYGASLDILREQILAWGGTPLNGTALGQRLFPVRARHPVRSGVAIDRERPVFDTATSLIASCLAAARTHEFGVVADHDTEFLHDYRIQLRKIRSILSLFKGVYAVEQTDELKARFSSLMATTGALRDLDVYLLEQPGYYALLPQDLHPGLDALFALLAEHRQAEQARLSAHLGSASYKREIGDLQRLFSEPGRLQRGPQAELAIYDYACDLIWKRYRKVSKIAAGIDAQTPDEEVHELRIQCKKLRYLMEFFAPMFPRAAFKTLLKPLKKLQDNLGLFNDYSVQQESLKTLLPKFSRKQSGTGLEMAQSVGALTAIMHHRQLEERAKVMANLVSFNSRATRQLFATLFQQGVHHA